MTDLVSTVAEDLEYLREAWHPRVLDPELRRGSTVVRRLLQGDFMRAWRLAGVGGKPTVLAPRVEFFLNHPQRGRIQLLVAGGGEYAGAFCALALMNAGNTPLQLAQATNPMEHPFHFREFCRSASIVLDHIVVRRAEVVSYVANKLGGAHFDAKRSGKLANKFKALDQQADRLAVSAVPAVKQKNAVFFELLSIGQLVARSEATSSLLAAV